MRTATTKYDWDEENLALTQASTEIDEVNARFYGQYPFPPRAHRLERSLDPDFQRIFLCQDVGDWHHQSVPVRPSIWVAGCGTNQALITALAFAHGQVLGSDVSAPSLEIVARGAREMGLHNLELRHESVNLVQYNEQFDYVLCTGVIHHNQDPSVPLRRIACSLKPGGLLELMVYGRYQRITSSRFQKALTMLAPGDGEQAFRRKLCMAKSMVSGFEAPGQMEVFLTGLRNARPAELADSLIQPVEHSYTVTSLLELAECCGLEMLLPAPNEFDKISNRISWHLSLPSTELQEAYMHLKDVDRWQVTNLLLGECCPLLWFYFRRPYATPRRSEREILPGSRHTYLVLTTHTKLSPDPSCFRRRCKITC